MCCRHHVHVCLPFQFNILFCCPNSRSHANKTTKRQRSEFGRPATGPLLSWIVLESHNTIPPFGTGTFLTLHPWARYQSTCSCDKR
jgi:hypothetical protein